jgi:putative dehydrogenase
MIAAGQLAIGRAILTVSARREGKQVMNPIVSVIAPGAMGSAIAARLSENGIEVRTSLAGRSQESAARAREAGMRPGDDDQVAAADIILSIVPPGQALALAERLRPAIARAERKPIYVDCNAVNPGTVARIAEVVAAAGASFVDGGIIGPPPKPGARATRVYLSGPEAERVAALRAHGLDLPILTGPIGVASAMKMSYAGITQGFTALGAAMMLGATRGGTAAYLQRELAASQPQLLAWLVRQVPGMYSKAYRWIAEMEQIGGFVGDDPAAHRLFEAAARFYEEIAADHAGPRRETGALDDFCRAGGSGPEARP